MRRFLVVAVVGVLAACGSSGGSSSGSGAYVDAAMKSYDNASASEKGPFTRTQARCLIQGIVDAVGVDTLKSNNIQPSDLEKQNQPLQSLGKNLSQAKAQQVAGVITDGTCFNFADVMVKEISNSGSNPFGRLTRTQARCFFNEILRSAEVKKAMAASILGQDSSSSALRSAFSNQSKLFTMLGKCNIRPSQLQG
jgi:hypothetical protein